VVNKSNHPIQTPSNSHTTKFVKILLTYPDFSSTHRVRNYRQHNANAILHILQFTVAHALGFSIFTSRILETDVLQSHCNFKSHVKSNSFLAIILQLPIPKTRLDYSPLRFHNTVYSASTTPVQSNTSYTHFARTSRKTPSSVIKNACLLDVLSLRAYVTGMCLPTRCL
jgi:hypothetical protein